MAKEVGTCCVCECRPLLCSSFGGTSADTTLMQSQNTLLEPSHPSKDASCVLIYAMLRAELSPLTRSYNADIVFNRDVRDCFSAGLVVFVREDFFSSFFCQQLERGCRASAWQSLYFCIPVNQRWHPYQPLA